MESLNLSCNIKHDHGRNICRRVRDTDEELPDIMALITGMKPAGEREGVDAMSNSDFILETKGLTKKFRGGYANRDISIHVKRNSIYGLLGPNGSGKSTFLKQVTGLLKPTQGEIYFHGHPWERKDLKKIGALIESPAIYPNLTARENMEVYRLLYGLENPEGKLKIDELLQTVGLIGAGNKPVKNYSTGMKQRLGLAVALLNSPELLILDEPANGLDPIGIEGLRDLISSMLEKGITVILSSHILKEVALVSTHIGILSNGRLRYESEIKPGEDLEQMFMDAIREYPAV
jgi:gallidermin-class lantibiotic protection ABC transporter ATP-binding subunit